MECDYHGITFDPKRNNWKARIHFEGKEQYIGRYDTAYEAALAYDQAARMINEAKEVSHTARRRTRPVNFPHMQHYDKALHARLLTIFKVTSPGSAPTPPGQKRKHDQTEPNGEVQVPAASLAAAAAAAVGAAAGEQQVLAPGGLNDASAFADADAAAEAEEAAAALTALGSGGLTYSFSQRRSVQEQPSGFFNTSAAFHGIEAVPSGSSRAGMLLMAAGQLDTAVDAAQHAQQQGVKAEPSTVQRRPAHKSSTPGASMQMDIEMQDSKQMDAEQPAAGAACLRHSADAAGAAAVNHAKPGVQMLMKTAFPKSEISEQAARPASFTPPADAGTVSGAPAVADAAQASGREAAVAGILSVLSRHGEVASGNQLASLLSSKSGSVESAAVAGTVAAAAAPAACVGPAQLPAAGPAPGTVSAPVAANGLAEESQQQLLLPQDQVQQPKQLEDQQRPQLQQLLSQLLQIRDNGGPQGNVQGLAQRLLVQVLAQRFPQLQQALTQLQPPQPVNGCTVPEEPHLPMRGPQISQAPQAPSTGRPWSAERQHTPGAAAIAAALQPPQAAGDVHNVRPALVAEAPAAPEPAGVTATGMLARISSTDLLTVANSCLHEILDLRLAVLMAPQHSSSLTVLQQAMTHRQQQQQGWLSTGASSLGAAADEGRSAPPMAPERVVALSIMRLFLQLLSESVGSQQQGPGADRELALRVLDQLQQALSALQYMSAMPVDGHVRDARACLGQWLAVNLGLAASTRIEPVVGRLAAML